MTVYAVSIAVRLIDMRVVADTETEARAKAEDAVAEWMDAFVPLDPDATGVDVLTVEEVEE